MSQHKPEPAYPKLLNLDTKRQTPSTGGLAPTPVITPTLTEHTTEIGAGANTPPYASTATSMTPCDRSCCYNVNPSYGHVTDMSPLSSPSSYAHAPEKPSDDQGSYEYPFGFSNGYHGASPLINNKNICEKDVSVGYSLTDCKWRLLDVLNALLYALLLLGVVLNVNVRVGWWVTGRDGNGGGEERSMLQGASGCDSDGCGGGRMGGVVLDTIRERREVQICRVLLAATSSAESRGSTYDSPPSRIYRSLDAYALKHCRSELEALTWSDEDQDQAAESSTVDGHETFVREPARQKSNYESKESTCRSTSKNPGKVTKSEGVQKPAAEAVLQKPMFNMPDDVAEEGRLGRVLPSHMHAGFGGSWRRRRV